MYRRDKQARLLTGGLIGALPVTTPGDEYWDDVTLLLNGEDATIADVSTASTAITVNSSVTQSTSVYKYGSGSLRFDEGGAGGIPGNSITYSRPAITGDFTIETWWRPDQFNYHVSGGSEYLWSFGNYSSSTLHPLLWVNQASGAGTNPTFNFYVEGQIRIESTATLTAGAWHHVAVTRSNSTYELFIDGVSQGTYAGSSSTIPSSTVYIGRRWTDISGNYYSLNGHLDDFRFTTGVARYTAAFTPPTASFLTNAPVVGRRGVGTYDAGDEHWDDVSLLIRGDTLTDLSANGHTLTANGNAAAGDTSPVKFASGSLTFDGAGDYITVPDAVVDDLGSGDWTFEGWFYPTSVARKYVTGSVPVTGNTNQSGIMLAIESANWQVYVSDNTSWTNISSPAIAANVNTWQHVAVTRQGSNLRLYVNGALSGSSSLSHSVAVGTVPFRLGRTGNFAGYDYAGNIEDFRITKGVARYTAGFSSELPTESFPTALTGTPEATATLRTRGYLGAAPAGGGMLTLYDRYVDTLT